MAQSPGSGLNWAQKAALWVGLKGASLLGRTFTLTDPGLYQFLGGTTFTGKAVTDQSAMQVSTVWACVRILAEGVGQLPLAIYKREKSGNLVKTDHALAEVLVDAPNADMTSPEYREALMTNMGLRGNAFSLVDRGASGRINSLYPMPSKNVQVKRLETGDVQYKINDRGRWYEVPASQIWHNRIFSLDGLNGLSPIGYAREAIGFTMGLEEFGARLFNQGANIGSVIKIPGWLNPDQRKQAEEKLQVLYQGLVNAGKPFILEGGMEIEKGILPPEDAQFLELRGFQIDDICRFYLVPPHRVARLDRATNNNIEQLSLEFVMYTLLPYLVKLERSADRWLFKPSERGDFVVRFNYDGLLRADSVARSQLLTTLLQNGVISRNEARDIEHRGRSEADGMDDYTVQSNMAMIQFLEAMSQTQGQQNAQSQQTSKAFAQMLAAIRSMPPPVVKVGDVSVDARSTVSVPEREVLLEATIQTPPAPDVEVNVQPASIEINAPVTVRAYPSESVETVERGSEKEIARVVRKNKD